MVEEQAVPITRSCAVAKLSREAYYRSQSDSAQRDDAEISALNEVVAKHQRWGFWKCFGRLRLLGHDGNHKRVYRVHCGMKLNLPRRMKRRVPQREPRSLVVPALPNAVWAVDFMSGTPYDGRRFRTLNVLDEGVREGLAIEIDTSSPAKRMIRVPTQLKEWRGPPQAIRPDNAPNASRPVIEGNSDPGRPSVHRAGQAGSERLHRALQSELSRGKTARCAGTPAPALFRQQVMAARSSTSELST